MPTAVRNEVVGPSPVADPSSPTGIGSPEICVVAHDAQTEVDIDADRWAELATATLAAEGCRAGELTLTFVDVDEISQLNRDMMGSVGPTDVLSFPLDDDPDAVIAGPVLLGDVVVCPAVAAAQASTHAGSAPTRRTARGRLRLLAGHAVGAGDHEQASS